MGGMSLSLGLGLGAYRSGGGFSPASLFAASEPGGWYDPSDLSTMFQDTAGTTPVTATGQTVGLVLDKSKGLVLGPELVTNGDFASATGWTLGTGWSISGGQLVGTNVTSTSATTQTITTGLGKTFLVTYTIVSITSGQVSVGVGASLGTARASAGTYTEYFVGTGATNGLAVYQRVSTTNATIDNISVKELAGNHLTQATAASRPIYGIEPFGGRRNLLTFTEQFDNAAWTKTNATVTANTTVSPDGTATADALVDDATNGAHTVERTPATLSGTAYTLSVYAKANTLTKIMLMLDGNGAVATTTFDLSAGSIETVFSGSATISPVGNGWYRCTVTGTTVNTAPYVRIRTVNASGNATYAGTGQSLFIWGAQLETGSTSTNYQRVTDQWNVTEAGVPNVSYVQYDGTDDWFISPTITPGIDKAQVFAGVRKLSDVATGMLAETGAASPFGTNGAFGMYAPITAGGANYAVISRGSSPAQANTAGSFAAPITNVLTGIGDIAGDVATFRVNGVQAATSTADQGTGNFLAYPLYVGRRGGTSLPFNGRLYGLITRFGANLTTDQIAQTETWMNSKTGAY